ncbi:uncharacterized protein LOC130558759 [Triplophysa rosa]|uniref:uncharacterized protein LOC130558759 n=1 Tax=Triplophysa rosa TaxID=992332 RepID=UPI002545E4CA|nr:uncharacterized protein LOC130558759 [Triplophysa rosa]
MNVKKKTKQCYDEDDRADGRFRDRLQVDIQTVSLIITDIRITHSGLYVITVSSQRRPLKIFNITVCVFATESVSVTEGDSVSLSVSLTLEQRGNKIMWRFGPTEVIIAEMNVKNNTKQCYDDRADGRFRDRLKLDVQSVSLIITDIRITHSGLYNITISRQEMPLKRFNITVYPRLPVPVISRVSSQCSSSSCCCVLCSVMNVSHVSVSWYKGKSFLSSISVSEHRDIISISLHLECLDDSYTCVLNNSITNQTQHLNTDVCHKCSAPSAEFYCCCGFTEVVIRLVVSALVGVAAVAVLVYDIRSRRDEQKKRSDTQLNDK